MQQNLFVYNTLTRKKELFKPLTRRMLACMFAALLFIAMFI
jgi:hypothetical protein